MGALGTGVQSTSVRAKLSLGQRRARWRLLIQEVQALKGGFLESPEGHNLLLRPAQHLCGFSNTTKQFCDSSWVSYNVTQSDSIYLERVSDPTG